MFNAIALLRFGAVGALAMGYIALSHFTLTTPGHALLGTAVAVTPLIAALTTAIWHTRYRFLLLALCLMLTLGLLLLTPWRLPDQSGFVSLHFSQLYWLEHAGTQARNYCCVSCLPNRYDTVKNRYVPVWREQSTPA